MTNACQWAFWSAVVLGTLCLPGCHRNIKIWGQASTCLNPRDRVCDDQETESRILDVAVFQLHESVDLQELRWDDFVIDRGLEVLDQSLADPEAAEDNKKLYTVPPGFEGRLEKFPRVSDSKYLLFVALGRLEGEHSIAITPLRWWWLKKKLSLEGYNVYVDGPALDRVVSENGVPPPAEPDR